MLTGGFLALWGQGFRIYGFSALFKPISEELGFTRAVTSVASSIGRLEGGFEAPISGWATDRYGPKWLIFGGVFVIGVGLILMYFIDSLWAFYVVWGVIVGTGANVALAIPLQTAIANWFVKRRGIAMSTQMVFSGLSGVLVLPLIAWLITVYGWRITCVIGGVVMLVAGLPLVWFFVRQRRPEFYGLMPDGATIEEEIVDTDQLIDKGVEYATEVEEVEFTLRQALRTPSLWMLTIANAAHGMSGPALYIHGVPFLTDIGMDTLKAAGMMSMMVAVSIPFRVVFGYLADRMKKQNLRFLLGAAYLLQASGFIVYLANQTEPMIYLWFILYGIGLGGGAGLMFPMRARFFGRKAIGSIGGVLSLIMTPIGVIAPIYLGWMWDTTGSYISAFTVIAALMVFASILAFVIVTPKPPAQITDVRKIM